VNFISDKKYRNYYNIQNQSIKEQFLDSPINFVVAAKSSAELDNYAKRVNGRLVKFDSNSFIVEKNNGINEIFVLGSCGQYRNIFRRFLTYCDPIDFPQEHVLPSHWHIDHIYNKARFKEYYLRIILLENKINRSWGANVESKLTRLEKDKEDKREVYFLDYITFFKIIGFSPIDKNDNVDEYAISVFNELLNIGDCQAEMKSEVLKGIRALLNYILEGVFYDKKIKPDLAVPICCSKFIVCEDSLRFLSSLFLRDNIFITIKDHYGNFYDTYNLNVTYKYEENRGKFLIEIPGGKSMVCNDVSEIEYKQYQWGHKFWISNNSKIYAITIKYLDFEDTIQ
jgi:Uri superfamily endonuclease